jgi:hypothetical protein
MFAATFDRCCQAQDFIGVKAACRFISLVGCESPIKRRKLLSKTRSIIKAALCGAEHREQQERR